MTDSWKGYKTDKPNEVGFDNFKVNHNYNFVDPESRALTQQIKRTPCEV